MSNLMITDPDKIHRRVRRGRRRDDLGPRPRCCRNLHRTIQAIKALGCKAGVVLNPSTPIVALHEVAADVDFWCS